MKVFITSCAIFVALIIAVTVLSVVTAHRSNELLDLADKAYSEIEKGSRANKASLSDISDKWQTIRNLIANVAGDSRASLIDEAIAEMTAANLTGDEGSTAVSLSRLRALVKSVIDSQRLNLLGIL